MFEDENDKRQSRKGNDNGYLSARDALTNNSAVKAAAFVAGLMVCVIVIYMFIWGGDKASPTGTTGAASSGTAGSNDTSDPVDTGDTGGATENAVTPTPTAAETAFSFKKDDSDPKIQEIQQELKNKKYLDNAVQLDNKLGQKTEEAIKLLQSDLNLEQTGIIDNALYAQLKNVPERFELKSGQESEKIKELQILLIDKGYLDMKKEDAVVNFGPKTVKAVKLFQKENSLKETGVVTSILYQMIEAAPVRNAG